jgi:hypothetical protein
VFCASSSAFTSRSAQLTEDELALAKLALALYAWSREPLTKAAEGKQITEFFSRALLFFSLS